MKKTIVMLGFLVGDNYFERFSRFDKNPQVAAKKLESAYLDGFLQNEIIVGTLGFFPASTYPGNKRLFFGFTKWADQRWALPYINLPGLKLITRLIVSLIGFCAWRVKYGGVDALSVYSVHSPYLVVAVLIKKLFGIPFFVIVPDLPLMMREGIKQGPLYRLQKKIDQYLIKKCLLHSSGLSLITRQMYDVLSPKQLIPYVVIEGLALVKSCISANDCARSRRSRPYFMYSGGLSEEYGVGAIVRAFISTDIDVDLVICGVGLLEGYISDVSRKDSRVVFLGFVGQNELGDLQSGARALILARSNDLEFVKYSFPSKLIEYIGSGSPVICTKLPGIPSEYYDFMTVLNDSDENSIRKILIGMGSGSSPEALEKAKRGVEFISKRTDPKLRVKKLVDIMFPIHKSH